MRWGRVRKTPGPGHGGKLGHCVKPGEAWKGAVFKVFLALEGPTILACTVVCKRSSVARNLGLDTMGK